MRLDRVGLEKLDRVNTDETETPEQEIAEKKQGTEWET